MANPRKLPPWEDYPDLLPATVAHIESQVLKERAAIARALQPESTAVYQFLSTEFQKGPVDKNPLFQFVYRSFYRLDNAGLTPEFKSRYFALMQEARSSGEIDLGAIAGELYTLKNLRGRNTLQFSFVTKLAATVQPDVYPIYDAEIARAFRFSTPYGEPDYAKRLKTYIRFYDWLGTCYRELLKSKKLNKAVELVIDLQPPDISAPRMKWLDSLFWTAGKLGIVVVP